MPEAIRAITLLCLTSLIPIGCAASGPKKLPTYNVIRLYNDSPDEIYDVELSAGGTVTTLDKLPPEHSPVSDRGVSPDPQTAEVKWRTYDGRHMRREIPVAKDVPPNFHGVIVLRLMPEGDVKLQFVSYKELK
jgi:hypothetical protein